MPVLEPLFHALELDVIVPPAGVLRDPPVGDAEALQEWWETVTRSGLRDTAFLDEKLSYAVAITFRPDTLPSSHDEPPELLSLAKHVQLTATASFLPPLTRGHGRSASTATLRAEPSSTSKASTAPTPTGAQPRSTSAASAITPKTEGFGADIGATPRPGGVYQGSAGGTTPKTATFSSGGSNLGVEDEDVGPLTPRPFPATTPDAEGYAALEGVTVWEGVVETEGDSGKPIFVKAQDGWTAVWRGEMPVVYVRTAINNPVLALTASATLRERPKRPGGTAPDNASIHTTTTMQTDDMEYEEPEEEIDLAAMEEIDLLGGLASGPMPSSRLGPSMRDDLALGKPATATMSTATSSVSPSPIPHIDAGTTLRKSFRRVFSLSPGLRVRMRTLFLPQLLPPGAGPSGPDDSEDAGERRVVLCVEVENGTDAAEHSFEIKEVTVDVGGKGAKATAELVCQPGQTAVMPSSPRKPLSPTLSSPPAADGVFPLRLRALEQYNLLYAVTVSSSERSAGDDKRPVSIVLTGKPFRPAEQIEYPTSAFQSRWNCTLDLTPFFASLPPAPPPPLHAGNTRHVQHRLSKPTPPTPNAVAGDKRYSLAALMADTPAPPSRIVSNPRAVPPSVLQNRVVSARAQPQEVEGHGLLVSVKLLSPGAGNDIMTTTEDPGLPSIRPLDTFFIEVFVHNRTDTVRRFRLGVPGRESLDAKIRDAWARRRRRGADEAAYGVDDSVLSALLQAHESAAPALVPLETDVRCGPLLPGASLAARVRFLALRSGVHRIERLRLTGANDDFDFVISPVVEVVVA